MFETKLTFWEKFFSAIHLIGGFVGVIYFMFQFTTESILIAGIFLFLAIQGFRSNVFILNTGELIIRKPWPIQLTKDIRFRNNEIERIIFRRIKGRFGGPHIVIKSKKKDISFRINWNEQKVDDFSSIADKLGVKLEYDNWDEY